ncbi:ABC transporter permease [Chryseolinea sp. T2]|uniref:ABC transporter permease n=1 Tax=Chryseolinea sp. T2 TaxID=3129255 RepID=UPI0030771556
MIKHLIDIATRNIIKYKFYSVINLLGLAVGIAGFVIIALYIHHELDYDKFHENRDRIYRVATITRLSGKEIIAATSPGPLANALSSEIPEVEASTRIFPISEDLVVRYDDKAFNETIFLADSGFFKIFTFEFVEGNIGNALIEPSSIVLTEEASQKYFGKEKALGKLMTINNGSAKVTGVIKNVPSSSHFHFDLLVSLSTDPSRLNSNTWGINDYYTYFLLRENASASAVDGKLSKFVDKYVSPVLKQYLGYTDERIRSQRVWEFFLQPLIYIHLKSKLSQELEPNANGLYVYILSVVALFILLIACVNYMIFSTAYSASRAKEIGVRKVLGSAKRLLVNQFLIESVVLSFFATLLSVVLVRLFLPIFNDIVGRTLAFNLFDNTWLALGIIILPLVVGVISGSYPAFYFSSLKPVNVLKGGARHGRNENRLRNALVVFQLIVAMCLIISTLFVYQQLQFLRDKNLGFDKENVLVISNNVDKFSDRTQAFKQDLLSLPEVVKVCNSLSVPGTGTPANNRAMREKNSEEDVVLFWLYADYDFAETFKIDIIAGRNFSRDVESDTEGILLNETAVAQLGLKDPVGKILVFPGMEDKFEVLGVMKDFNFESLHANVRPLGVTLDEGGNFISVRILPENLARTVEDISTRWKAFSKDSPFEYFFLDQKLDSLFKSDQRLGKVATLFSILAIFVCCLGLFGLVTFTAEQRAKEISIRKVLGSETADIFFLLSKDFALLLLVANLIAMPLSYLFIKSWLEGFAYQTLIKPEVFLLGFSIEFAIAFSVICFQLIKASNVSPIRHINS